MFNKEFEQYIQNKRSSHCYSAAKALENGEKVSAYLMDGKYYDCGTPNEYIELLKGGSFIKSYRIVIPFYNDFENFEAFFLELKK